MLVTFGLSENLIFENQKMCLTLSSVSLRRVRLRAVLANFGFANISISKNELLSKTILACSSGAQIAWIHEIKKCQKFRDSAPLKQQYHEIKGVFLPRHQPRAATVSDLIIMCVHANYIKAKICTPVKCWKSGSELFGWIKKIIFFYKQYSTIMTKLKPTVLK